jgi:hypothetical protein
MFAYRFLGKMGFKDYGFKCLLLAAIMIVLIEFNEINLILNKYLIGKYPTLEGRAASCMKE